MGKVKIVFSAVTLIISILLIINTIKFEERFNPAKYTPPAFQVTGISENSKLFQDLSLAKPLTVDNNSFQKNLRVKTDPRTSFEVIYKGTLLTILPNSHIFYNVRMQTLSLIFGEIFWNKLSKSPVSIFTEEGSTPVTISKSGRMRITHDGQLQIWSYKGEAIFNSNESFVKIPTGRALFIDEENVQTLISIPPAITYIAPKNQDVYIEKLTDFLVKIDWKLLLGITNYKVKVYTSKLKENILIEKTVTSNRTGLDLAEFAHVREFYWEITPLSEEMYEGEPSEMGKIRLFGIMLKEEKENLLSKLIISSMNVTGNKVLIKGSIRDTSDLYINEVSITIDINGDFAYTQVYTTLGLKKITFKVISPLGVESILTKQVTINEE